MPKSSFRCKHTSMRRSSCTGTGTGSGTGSGTIPVSFLISAPPRKVSFEDANRSNSDSDPSICYSSDDTVPAKNNNNNNNNHNHNHNHKKTTQGVNNEGERRNRSPPMIPIRRKRSLLVRPITSLSLVDLAKSVPQPQDDNVSSTVMITGQQDLGDESHHTQDRKSKRIRSLNHLSPRSIVYVSTPKLSSVDMNQQQHLDSHSHSPQASTSTSTSTTEGESSKSMMRTSPLGWGHFIEMVPDEDDYEDNFQIHSAYPNYDAILKPQSHSSCNESSLWRTRRRRRPSPYAEYKTSYSRTIREAAKPALTFIRLRTDDSSLTTPVISKTKSNQEATTEDQLIGVFSELQVRRQQKTNVQQQCQQSIC